jgi:hypothetical protein
MSEEAAEVSPVYLSVERLLPPSRCLRLGFVARHAVILSTVNYSTPQHILTSKVQSFFDASSKNIRCPMPSVAQRSKMNQHTRHLGGFRAKAVDDYWVK